MLTRDGLACVSKADGKRVARGPQEHATGSLALADNRLFVAPSRMTLDPRARLRVTSIPCRTENLEDGIPPL